MQPWFGGAYIYCVSVQSATDDLDFQPVEKNASV